MVISLISIFLACVFLFILFNSKKRNKSLRFLLLAAADICLFASVYYEPGESTVNTIILNCILFLILNTLGIRHILAKESPDQEKYDKWHADPVNWKGGIFYYNPEDKRIFPPKKLKGMGWTINFANPASVLAFLGLFLLILVIMNIFK